MKVVDFKLPTIFLAGPTTRGNQPHLKSWRFDAIADLEKNAFSGNVIVPEFTNRKESDKYRYDLPVWENEGLTRSDIILIWLCRTKEMIGLNTNSEFGYWMARDREKIVYGRPDNAYRIAYNDIMWVEDAKRQSTAGHYVLCPIYNTLYKTIMAALEKIDKPFVFHESRRYRQ